MTASRSGTRSRSPNISTSSSPTPACCRRTRAARAHCRSISGEMHSGFSNLRSALPMNLKAHYPGFKVWAGAQADIDRIITIWRECLAESKGPFLFGEKPCMADAMFAPVCTRFLTYDVKLDATAPPIARPSWRCRRCRNGSTAPRPSRTSWKSSTWSSSTAVTKTLVTPDSITDARYHVRSSLAGKPLNRIIFEPKSRSSARCRRRARRRSSRSAPLNAGVLHRAIDRRVELIDDLLRHARRPDHADVQVCAFVAGHAGFRDRRQDPEMPASGRFAAHREPPHRARLARAARSS